MASSWVSITAEGVSFSALEKKWRASVIQIGVSDGRLRQVVVRELNGVGY